MRKRLGGLPAGAWVVAAFLLSRAVYRVGFGVELDASPPRYFLQFLDPSFLEHDLTRSVLSLHHQAPLLNLVYGLCQKLLGPDAPIALDVILLALGLGGALAMATTLEQLVERRWIAALGASLWVASPITVIYESWLFYPHVVASILAIAGALLLRFARGPTVGRGAAFFAVLALVGLVRSTFGPLWFLSIFAALFAFGGFDRKTLAKAAAIPLAVLLLHSAKTPLYVGHGYGDAMLWPNIAKKIYVHLTPDERRRLAREKIVSPAMKYEAFSDLASMKEVRVPHDPTGIPALDEPRAPNGRPNANALEHVLIAERYYKHDALTLLSKYPGAYALSALEALVLYVPRSPTKDSALGRNPNLTRLGRFDRAIDTVGLTTKDGFSPVIAALLVVGLAQGISMARRRPSPQAIFATFALLTIVYSTAVTVLVSWGDFSRYRYEVDGLFWPLIVLGLWSIARAALSWRSSRRRRDAPSEAAPP